MARRLWGLRLGGELSAILFGMAGAALSVAMTQPPRVHSNLDWDQLGAAPRGPQVQCDRSYSTVRSLDDEATYDDPYEVAQRCVEAGIRDCDPSTWLDRETAICFAEEHYFGEGQARDAHLEVDHQLGTVIWAIMGASGEVVVVSAQ